MILDYSMEKLDKLKAQFSGAIESVVVENTDAPILFVSKKNIISFLSSIRIAEGFEYNFLADLTAVDDNPPTDKIADYGLGVVAPHVSGAPRFHVVYQLLSMKHHDRIRVKVALQDGEDVPTVVAIWKGANWLEREVFDMYGIRFSGHPDLRRILLDERWVGYPQRKDYPIKKYQRFEGSLEFSSVTLE